MVSCLYQKQNQSFTPPSPSSPFPAAKYKIYQQGWYLNLKKCNGLTKHTKLLHGTDDFGQSLFEHLIYSTLIETLIFQVVKYFVLAKYKE